MTAWKRREVIGGLLDGVVFTGFPSPIALIYGLRESPDAPVSYVGSTTQPIKARIRSHIGDARKGSPLPVHEWVRSRDCRFCVTLLKQCRAENRAEEERRLVELHQPSLNVTDGGPGMSGHNFAGTPHALRIASAHRTGAVFSCEECGKAFWRKRREIRLGNNRFCSRGCYQSWQRGRSKKRTAS